MKKITLSVLMLAIIVSYLSCKKTTHESNINSVGVEGIKSGPPPPGRTTNQELLQMVVSGGGGDIVTDSGRLVRCPTYSPPFVADGMMNFATIYDLNLFSEALDLLVDYWTYSNIDYEDTPLEITHLGEEPLNALDSTLRFNSLRYKYELFDFNAADWEDTTRIYVEDDDLQSVLNENFEIKIGNKYYKFLNNHKIAIINNSDLTALNNVRERGMFALSENLQLWDEGSNAFVTLDMSGTQQAPCFHGNLVIDATRLTTVPVNNQYEVELSANFFIPTIDETRAWFGSNVQYTINWGDGSSEVVTQTLNFRNVVLRHMYTITGVPPGGTTSRTISVSARFVSNVPTFCQEVLNDIYQKSTDVYFTIPAECIYGNKKRKFYGREVFVGSTKYRMKCKISQKIFSFAMGNPKVKAVGEFYKFKNNSVWRKIKPLGSMTVKLRGNIYAKDCLYETNCNDLLTIVNLDKTTSNKKKLKVISRNLSCFSTTRAPLYFLNADYIWTDNRSNPTSNLQEPLIR